MTHQGRPHIGTLGEKPLHAALKEWCREPGDLVEQPVEGFVIDLVRGHELIEVQTRGFASMKRKLGSLLGRGHTIRIAFPVATNRWIVKIDEAGEVLGRRMSPRHEAPIDIFSELVYIKDLINHPGLTFEVLETDQDEVRRHSPDKAWRRKGWVVVERHLIDVHGSRMLSDGYDLLAMLPAALPEEFTTRDIADAWERPIRLAQQAAYCLKAAGSITPAGKKGQSVKYVIAQ